MTKNLDLLKPEDVASILNVHKRTVYRLAKEHKIPYIQIGGTGFSLRFDRKDVENFITSNSVNWHFYP